MKFIILLLIVLLHALNNWFLLRIDETPLTYDAHGYFYQSIEMHRLIKEGKFFKTFHLDQSHPPLLALIASFLYFTFEPTPDLVRMLGILFLGVLIFSVFGVACIIFKDHKIGILGSLIVSFYPLIIGHSRHFMADLPQTAFLWLGLYFYFKSDSFKSFSYSTLAGIAFGLALLTKANSAIFLLVLLPYLIKGLKADKLNAISFSLALILIPLPWYLYNFLPMLKYFTEMGNLPLTKFEDAMWYQNMGFYFQALWQNQLSSINFVFLLMGIAIIFLYKVKLREVKFLLYWTILPIFILSLMPVKISRYGMAYLPALALLTSLGLSSLRGGMLRGTILILLIFINLVQYLILTYIPGGEFSLLKFNVCNDWYRPKDKAKLICWEMHYLLHFGLFSPCLYDWEGVAEKIVRDLSKAKQVPLMVFLVNDYHMVTDPLRSIILKRGLTIELKDFRVSPPKAQEVGECILAADYVLYFDAPEKASCLHNPRIEDIFVRYKDRLKLIKQYLLPKNIKLQIYHPLKEPNYSQKIPFRKI